MHLPIIQNWKRTNAIWHPGHLSLTEKHPQSSGWERPSPTALQTPWHIEGQRRCGGHEFQCRNSSFCRRHTQPLRSTHYPRHTGNSSYRSCYIQRHSSSHRPRSIHTHPRLNVTRTTTCRLWHSTPLNTTPS